MVGVLVDFDSCKAKLSGIFLVELSPPKCLSAAILVCGETEAYQKSSSAWSGSP